MRLFFGIIIGIALTIGGTYIADSMAGVGSRMVNWDVVGKNFESITSLARDGWKKITG
jgi:hypothetical protein